MLKPSDRQHKALLHTFGSDTYREAILEYLKADREQERGYMEASEAADTEVRKGRCRKCTELINFIESLPQGTGSSS